MGCRKEIYFLEFLNVDLARDFVGVVFRVLPDGAKGSHNHRDCRCFEPPHSLTIIMMIIMIIIINIILLIDCQSFMSCYLA